MMRLKEIKWEQYVPVDEEKADEEKSYLDMEKEDDNGFGQHVLQMENMIMRGPFGHFHKNNKFNPYTFYKNIFIGSFVGCNYNTIDPVIRNGKELIHKLDTVEGVSAWRLIDPHTIILIIAKYYEKEVLDTVNSTLLGSEYNHINNTIGAVLKKSEQFLERDIPYFVLSLPNFQIVSSTVEDPNFEQRLQEAHEIHNSRENTFMIVNGNQVEKNK